jgi:hypothetical protein
MTKRTIPEVCAETLRLQVYIEEQPDGAELSFEKIAYDTGISMDELNKGHLRSALRRSKREYSSIYGYGIRLADSASVMPILTTRLVKIDKTVRRGEKTQKALQERFFRSLSADDQKNVLFIGACFGAIRVAAENGKLLFQKPKPKQLTPGMTIPYSDSK